MEEKGWMCSPGQSRERRPWIGMQKMSESKVDGDRSVHVHCTNAYASSSGGFFFGNKEEKADQVASMPR
jgi:hypothetical protein